MACFIRFNILISVVFLLIPPSLALPTAVIDNQIITGGVDHDDISVEFFKGIPYADPPIGPLRFKHPVAFSGSYSGLKANTFGYSCPSSMSGGTLAAFDELAGVTQYFSESMINSTIDTQKSMTPMDEDCLTINVFRPRNTKPGHNLPVMVWIYGGAFQFGSSSMYDGGVYVRESIKMNQPVLLVTFNYRLGALGFLGGRAVQNEHSTNSGLMDQRLALQWVSQHISAFGGDPIRVTIFGESAGAMSIAAHMAMYDGDNMYNGKPLFAGAIMQSGAVLPTEYTDDSYPEEMFWKFAKSLGCFKDYGEDDSVVMACLRNITFEEIIKVEKLFIKEKYGLMDAFISWSPRCDGEIFSVPIHQLFAEGHFTKIPFITGNQQDEGTLFGLVLNTTHGSETRKLFNLWFRKAFPDQINKLLWLYPDNPFLGAPFNTGVRNAITSQYKRISAFITDFLFHSGRRLMLNSTNTDATPTYVYHAENLHNIVPVLGTFHAGELIWQWHLDTGPAEIYRRYFIAFANYGDPNIGVGKGLPHWERYTALEKQVLGIGIQSQMLVHQNDLKLRHEYQMYDTYRSRQIDYMVENYPVLVV